MTEDLDKDEKYIEANTGILLPGEHSKDYYKWIKSKEFAKHLGENKCLTKTQARFAESLFTIHDQITVPGDIEIIFKSIRQHLKHIK